MEKKEINPLFTKEIAQTIYVPKIIKDDLCNIIEEKLKKTGFYYRIAYRVKKPESIVEKLIRRNYRKKGGEYENKKMQDLVGLRIILYFEDDMSIIRNLLNTLFSEPGEWETTETKVYEFRAMKINGIFKMPTYLNNMIVNPHLTEYIDDTFEIQARTNAFEGWHEVEHDLHYKGSAFDDVSDNLTRRMNSILATLELCDDSIVKLLEDLGMQHYKDKNWEDMLRCRFRIKMTQERLFEELISYFNENDEVVKEIFMFNREKLLTYLWNRLGDTKEITINQIVEIINNIYLKDEKLFEIFEEYKNKDNTKKRKKFEPFKPLGKFPVFVSNVSIDHTKDKIDEAFDKATTYIYSWIKSRLKNVFTDLKEEVDSYENEMPGYKIVLKLDRKNHFFSEMTTHPDTDEPNRMWISNAYIKEKNGVLHFQVTNHFAQPEDSYIDLENTLFSRPNFYGEIANNIGIKDVDRLFEEAKVLETKEALEDLYDLIHSERRRFPVIVFMASEKNWLNQFDVDFFAFLVGYYAHVRIIEDETLKETFSKEYDILDENGDYKDSIVVFYSGTEAKINYKKDILEASFEVIKYETKRYWNEKGCSAFRRQLISDIRDRMILNYKSNKGFFEDSVFISDNKEMWDVCDENGNNLGYTISRIDAKQLLKGTFHKVVSIYTVTKNKKILITRRSGNKSHPHKWEITCGSILAGEDIKTGAIREVLEETGIRIEEENLHKLYTHIDNKRNCIYYGFLNVLDKDDTDINVVIDEKEVDMCRFETCEDFYKLIKSDKFTRSEAERFFIYEDIIKEKINTTS